MKGRTILAILYMQKVLITPCIYKYQYLQSLSSLFYQSIFSNTTVLTVHTLTVTLLYPCTCQSCFIVFGVYPLISNEAAVTAHPRALVHILSMQKLMSKKLTFDTPQPLLYQPTLLFKLPLISYRNFWLFTTSYTRTIRVLHVGSPFTSNILMLLISLSVITALKIYNKWSIISCYKTAAHAQVVFMKAHLHMIYRPTGAN